MSPQFKQTLGYLGVLAIAVGGFFYYQKINGPCTHPIPYRLGTFDTQFGLSQKDFLTDIGKAADIWNFSLQKKLFQYDPQATLSINLLYDDRQKAVVLRDQIDSSNVSASQKKWKLDALRNKYDSSKIEYESVVTTFNSQASKYSKAEYAAKRRIVEDQRETLNNFLDQINTAVVDYNSFIRTINSKVVVANKTVGEIEEGFYTSGLDRIDIYEYENKTKLIRVLAHEFGHALGLDHNTNPESIMYKLNEGTDLNLTKEDVVSLKGVCGLNKKWFIL